jgi:hypothetical protein
MASWASKFSLGDLFPMTPAQAARSFNSCVMRAVLLQICKFGFVSLRSLSLLSNCYVMVVVFICVVRTCNCLRLPKIILGTTELKGGGGGYAKGLFFWKYRSII